MIAVVDSSAIINSLVDAGPPELMAEIRSHELAAPHLLDLEVLSVLRRLVLRREVSETDATNARQLYASMNIKRYAADGVVERIWRLRDNLSCYDGAYVVLAEVLEAPLFTCDAKIAGAAGHNAEIRVYR
jgi:predicted nucleic acid-binding protein